MELNKQDIFAPIKPEVELPEKSDYYVVKQMGWGGHRQLYYSSDSKSFRDRVGSQNGIKYWLKSTKDVFVLTQDELNNIKFQSYNEGYAKGKEQGKIPF